MKVSEPWQWALVYLGPALVIAIPTMGAGPLMLLLGGLVGVFVGFSASELYFSSGFKVLLFCGSLVSVGLFITGLKFKRKFWGKALSAVGVYLWCILGLIGFGPQ